MPYRTVAAMLIVLMIVAIAAIPVMYHREQAVTFRNFRVVEPGILYRSGQMCPEGFSKVVREHGIATVISLRDTTDERGTFADQFEVDLCHELGIAHIRVGPGTTWLPPEQMAFPFHGQVVEFLRILDDPATERPVLVHCFAGVHRTGACCAVYRMNYQNWTGDEAIREMRAMGTARTNFGDDLIRFLATYQSAAGRGSRSIP